MQIETVAIDSLIPDPSNARRHDAKNLDAIKGSLAKFGQRKPIVVRNNIVLAGNGTLEAAKALGWTEISVAKADDLSSVDATAYALADNRSSELASWDMDTLGSTLHSLREEDFDLTGIGFDTSDLDILLGEEKFDEIEPPKLPEKHMLTVTFEDDAAQQDLFIELRDRGFKVKV